MICPKAVLIGIVALAVLAGCAENAHTPMVGSSSAGIPIEYRERIDGNHIVPALHPSYLSQNNRRRWVRYNGPEQPGTLVVDPYARVLYHVVKSGLAMRFRIAVGRSGERFSGSAIVGRKEKYPYWTPTASMVRANPSLYGPVAKGLEGGEDNPLGARALYLYRNGRDTLYRIHGTMDPSSIGHATSAGCIRLFNQDIIDLFDTVPLGTRVIVRTEAESLKYEGVLLVHAKSGIVTPGVVVGIKHP